MPPPQPHPSPSHQHTSYFNAILNTSSSATTTSSQSRPPSHAPTFTSAQRSAQARHKEWNSPSGSGRPSRSAESYEQRQERDKAASILESSEMLMWFAAARNESIPQTRHYYQNIVLGLGNQQSVDWCEEWEIAVQEREEVVASPSRSAKGKEKERERATKRVSSAHAYA